MFTVAYLLPFISGVAVTLACVSYNNNKKPNRPLLAMGLMAFSILCDGAWSLSQDQSQEEPMTQEELVAYTRGE